MDDHTTVDVQIVIKNEPREKHQRHLFQGGIGKQNQDAERLLNCQRH